MPQLTVHHLHVSQSERLPWLLEELKIPYNLKLYTRSPLLAPPEYKSLHPQGTAPILTDDGSNVVLAESGACIEYICHKYASGKLFLKPGYTNYPDFLYWWHWANASFMPAVARVFWRSSSLSLRQEKSLEQARKMAEEKVEQGLRMLDEAGGERVHGGGCDGCFPADDVSVFLPGVTGGGVWECAEVFGKGGGEGGV